MKTESSNYIDQANLSTLQPRYVLALSFDDDNTDITYITSHVDCLDPGGVAAIDRIDGALQPDGISGQTQRIAPENAQHTIGSVSFKILDVAGALTTKINTKLAGGEGLRHKRIRLYKGFDGLSSWDDYALRLTYRVEDVQYMDGVYTLSTGDIQRQAKTKIFEPHQGVLTSTLTASATTVPITIANAQDKFPLVYHDAKWDAHINQAVGYIQIDDEIIAHSGWTDATYTALTVVERGALGTVAVEHEVTATEEDQKKKVDEYIYLQMQSPRMAYALLTGKTANSANATSGRTLSTLPILESQVENGNQELGDNTGFSPLTYQATGGLDAGPCFSHPGISIGVVTMDDFISVEPASQYLIRGAIKADSNAGLIRYMGFACYDANFQQIDYWECWRDTDKNTTLYEDVSPTDITVKIVPAAESWFSVTTPFSYIQWDIKNDGSDFPQQNAGRITNIDTSTAAAGYWLLTLNSAAGVTYPSGTAVGNSTSGGTYSYALHSGVLPDTNWKQTTSLITGLNAINSVPAATEFRRGTAYIKILCYGAVGDATYFDNIEFSRFFYDSLPDHWHLGISTDYTRLTDFTGIGADLWDTTNNTGRVARFMGLDGDTGKAFIEKELLLWMGAYMPVHADGTLGLRRLKSVLPYAGYDAYLDSTQIIRYGALQYDQAAVINDISIAWNWIDTLDRYTKTTRLFDANSISKHGTAAQKTYEFRGVFNGVHTDSDLQNYFENIRDRYSAPPLRLQIDVMPQWDKIEVGDTVRVDLSQHVDYHIDDTLSRTFEVQQVRTDWITGKVSLTLFGGVEAAAQDAIATSFVLSDAFYGSGGSLGGTDLTSVLTISAGAITANGSLTGGDYYYDGGDLTLNSGVTVTITGTVRLRVKGFFTVNGNIDGTGGGAAGGAGGTAPSGTYSVAAAPAAVAAVKPAYGTLGQFGASTQTAGPQRSLNSAGNYITTWHFGESSHSMQPLLPPKSEPELLSLINPDGLSLQGIAQTDALTGSGGGGGESSYTISLAGGNYTFGAIANGGAGGTGGAGLAVICRGMSFGAAGQIDVSGTGGTSGGSGVYDSDTYYAAPGCSGWPGAVYVLIDGDGATPDRSKIITKTGNSTAPSASDYITRGQWARNTASAQSFAVGFFGTLVYDHPNNSHRDHLRIQYIPRALNGFTWYPAQEARQVTGYENKPVEWDQIADSAGLKPANNATVNNIYRVAAASPPATPVAGDMWYQTDTGRLQSYDGAAWQPAATQNLVTRAGSAPSSPQVGDLWFNTTSGAMQSYDGSVWQPVATQNLVTRAGSAPSTPQVGDLWFNTTSGAMQSYDGSVWQPVATQNLVTRAAGAPSSPQVGDLWFNTTSGAMQSYDGSVWQPVATQNLVTRAGSAPSSPQVGDLWIDTSGGASTEVTQVYDGSAWQDMATNGATAGTNLRDAALNLIGDADVLNSYNVLDSAITVTVGTGGDYATINAALVGLTQKFPTYASTAARATINLLTGTQITEQVIVDGIDLSWITISSVDATVTENISSFSAVVNPGDGLGYFPIISVLQGGKSPVLDIKITTDFNSTRNCGILCVGAGSTVEFSRGSANGLICTTISPNTSIKGVILSSGGLLTGVLTSITGFYNNVGVSAGAQFIVPNAVLDDAHGIAVSCSDGGRFISRSPSIDNAGSSLAAVYCSDGGYCSLYGATIDSPTGDGIHAVGATVEARNSSVTTIPVGKNAYCVFDGGYISANGGTASTNQTVNTITTEGLIIQ